jgi:predicted dehydrogenase
MKLRVGLVGLGQVWETRHRPALRALSDRFEVRAVCEQVFHRAEQAAREFNAVAVDGYRALAEREDVDALLMLSRQWFGPLPIIAACDAGKAVYCAGGLEMSFEEARRLKERIDQSGIAFMAEFPRRHAPATLRLKELIATRLGQPRLLFCHQRVATRDSAPAHRWSQPQRTPFQDLVELVDWCTYVVGHNPTSVFGLLHDSPGTSDDRDYHMMNLDFSDGRPGTGPTAQISCGRYMPDCWPEAVAFRPPAALQVACEHGVAFIDLPSTLTWFDGAGRHLESLESERPVGEQLLAQFFRAVTSLVRNKTGLEDAHRAIWIVHKAHESHQQGQRVSIDSTNTP